MLMKRFKFFMTLALLIAGTAVSTARNYTVEYRGLPEGVTGDYKLSRAWDQVDYSNNSVDAVQYQKTSSSALSVNGRTISLRNGAVSNNNYLTSNFHPEYYVYPKQIEGYDATVTTSNSYPYSVTITYSPTTVTKWNDDIFEYSTRHTQGTGNIVDLPDGEVSISLYKSETETITDIINYYGPLWNGATVNEVRELSDYDVNTGIETTASYKYLGMLLNQSSGSARFFYERTHTIPVSKVTDVTIPTEVTNGDKTYKVTAIQKWGFSYSASDLNMRYKCTSNYSNWKNQELQTLIDNGTAVEDWGNINDHRNNYLVNVRFTSPSNVTQIGDYAFMSNTVLQSIVIPNSVENLGQGIWECCTALTDLRFQTTTITNDDGSTYEGVKFNTIKNFTFWFCTALQTLVLPEGITTIEGTPRGAPLQYMFSLIDLKLPNTLKTVGEHFICCCTSLETLTIPAGVTDIDGACFHGCESLKTVYLLGPAGSLDASSGNENGATFGENQLFCADHVNNCTFYTTKDYITSYASHSTWGKIADNTNTYHGNLVDEDGNLLQLDDGSNIRARYGEGYGNTLTWIEGEHREFIDGKWVTCCFPVAVENYKSDDKFGAKAIAAVMIDGINPDTQEPYTYAEGDHPCHYHVSFKEIDSDDIPANTPVLLLPRHTTAKNYSHEMMPNINFLSDEQKEELTKPQSYTVEAVFTDREETAKIKMISKYLRQLLNPGDFYFISSGKYTADDSNEPETIGQFKRVAEQEAAPYIEAYRCYWQVNIDDVVSISNAKMYMNYDTKSVGYDDSTDGINEIRPGIVIDGIYDVSGKKIDVNPESLPQGLFIVNGKKVIINK